MVVIELEVYDQPLVGSRVISTYFRWPGQDSGLEAIADIRRRQLSAPIIVITALATFESAVDAIARGVW
jgi:ActR/RegA family two-component response regulator